MCMCVKKTDRSKKIVFVLSGGIYTSLCEGLNMEDEIRQLAAGVPPCPLRPLFTSQWAERNLCYLLCFSSRLREREGQHGLCLLLKKTGTLSYTHLPATHIFYSLCVSLLLDVLLLYLSSPSWLFVNTIPLHKFPQNTTYKQYCYANNLIYNFNHFRFNVVLWGSSLVLGLTVISQELLGVQPWHFFHIQSW